MRKFVSVLVVFVILFSACTANADGLLPSLRILEDVDMPSLSWVLRRLPDAEEIQWDDSRKVTYSNVTEADYDAFSTYLKDCGCRLVEYTAGEDSISFTLGKEHAAYAGEERIFTFEYNARTQEAVFYYPAGCQEDMSWAQEVYAGAEALLESGDYAGAIAAFERISGYEDAGNKLQDAISKQLDKQLEEAFIRVSAKMPVIDGKYVTFGVYEQDGDESNGKEPIEWLVLDYDSNTNQALLISRYALDAQTYNTESVDITWEKCTLRAWLNNEFMSAAFTEEEQKAIPAVTVKAEKNPDYNTDPGSDTQDRVFLLSISEAKKYFESDDIHMCVPTDYAISQGVWTNSSFAVDGRATCYWWLRSPGNHVNIAACVNCDGSVNTVGGSVNNSDIAVCPTMYLDLNLIP